jgi:hypothetical protein
MVSD